LQVHRLRRDNELAGDIIYDDGHGLTTPHAIHDIEEPSRSPYLPTSDSGSDLLKPVFARGAFIGEFSVEAARERAAADLAALSPRTRRFLNPQPYPVGLDPYVHHHKLEMIAVARAKQAEPPGGAVGVGRRGKQ
jgi:hypothetical protein